MITFSERESTASPRTGDRHVTAFELVQEAVFRHAPLDLRT